MNRRKRLKISNERLEPRNQRVIDPVDDASKHQPDINGADRRDAGLVKAYADRKLYIGLYVGLGLGEFDLADWFVEFDALPKQHNAPSALALASARACGIHHEHCPMLVDIVEFPQDIKPVPSTVRLYSFDLTAYRLADRRPNHRPLWLEADRKSGFPSWATAIGDHQLPGKMVESSAGIVDGIADHERPTRGHIGHILWPINVCLPFPVYLTGDAVQVAFSPRSDFLVQHFEVVRSPFQFGYNTSPS